MSPNPGRGIFTSVPGVSGAVVVVVDGNVVVVDGNVVVVDGDVVVVVYARGVVATAGVRLHGVRSSRKSLAGLQRLRRLAKPCPVPPMSSQQERVPEGLPVLPAPGKWCRACSSRVIRAGLLMPQGSSSTAVPTRVKRE
jgi:hypothetical protein